MSMWSPDQIMSGAGNFGSSSINFGAISGLSAGKGAAVAPPASKAATPSTASAGSVSVSSGFGTTLPSLSNSQYSSVGSSSGSSSSAAPVVTAPAPTKAPDQVVAQAAPAPAPAAPKFTPMTAEQRNAFSAAKPQADMSTVLPVERGAPPSSWTDSAFNTTTAPNVRMSALASTTPQAPNLKNLAINPDRALGTYDRSGITMVKPADAQGSGEGTVTRIDRNNKFGGGNEGTPGEIGGLQPWTGGGPSGTTNPLINEAIEAGKNVQSEYNPKTPSKPMTTPDMLPISYSGGGDQRNMTTEVAAAKSTHGTPTNPAWVPTGQPGMAHAASYSFDNASVKNAWKHNLPNQIIREENR